MMSRFEPDACRFEHLNPNKISGVSTNFRLLVYVFPGPHKRRVCKPSML